MSTDLNVLEYVQRMELPSGIPKYEKPGMNTEDHKPHNLRITNSVDFQEWRNGLTTGSGRIV